MRNDYCTYIDKDNLIKGVSLINSIIRNCSDSNIFILCLDEISRLIINKLKFSNVHTIALHEIESKDESLITYKSNSKLTDYQSILAPTLLLYIIDNYSEIECLSFIYSNFYFLACPDIFNYKNAQIHYRLKLENNNDAKFLWLTIYNNDVTLNQVIQLRQLLLQSKSKNDSLNIFTNFILNNDNFNEISDTDIVFTIDKLTNQKINKFEDIIYIDNNRLIAYNFSDLVFINQFIIIPALDLNQKLSLEIIQICYEKYIEELYNSLVSVRGYLSDFSEGLNNKDLLTLEHTFIAFKSVFEELDRQDMPYNSFELGNNLKCYTSDQLITDSENNQNFSSIWTDSSDFKGQNSLLEIMFNKKISNEIKTLYIIGAHKFQEREIFNYIFPNLENIYLFEPIKTIYDYLKGYEEIDNRIKVFNFAISDSDGTAEFNLADNEGASSSLYEFGVHSQVFPNVKMINKIEVQTRCLNTLINNYKLNLPDMLFIDAQGAEFEILNSIKFNILSGVIIIHSQVNKGELFKGQKYLTDVIRLLEPQFDYVGYTPLDIDYPLHGNALFVNSDFSDLLIQHCEVNTNTKPTKYEFKVTAIVSTYNSEEFIRECLQNLVEQTLFEKEQLEIIVIDRASLQNENIIIQEFQNNYDDERIKYIHFDENNSLFKALNNGIQASTCKYISNSNTFDRYRKDAFELMSNYLDNNLEVGVVYADSLITNIPNDNFIFSKANTKLNLAEYDYSILEKRNIIGTTSIWRKSIHNLYGFFNNDFKSLGDYEFWLRIGKFVKFYHYTDILGLNYSNSKNLQYLGIDHEAEYHILADNYGLTEKENSYPIPVSIKELNSLPYRDYINPCQVSVIMPTLGKRKEFIKHAIESVLSQTFKNLELIIINDGGDDIINIIEEYQDKRIQYHIYSENHGRAFARNFGIKNANGKYIAYLDDDDFYYENHLSLIIEFLENSGNEIAYTDAYRAEQIFEANSYKTIAREIIYSQDFDYDGILVGNFIPNLCVVHKKECTDLLGAYDESLHTHEDWDLWIRLSKKYKFNHLPTATCEFTWRTDGSSTTSNNRKDFIKTKETIFKKYSEYSLNNPKVKYMQSADLSYLKSEINKVDKTDSFSVIIPVFNNLDYTKNCIESIIKFNTSKIPIELILINNCSTDGTAEYLLNLANKKIIKLINNDENLSFAIACNQGAKISAGKYLIFLNNDTKVTKGWLDSLLNVFQENEQIAIQGAKLIYPNNTIQHCGIVYGYLSKTLLAHYHIYLNAPHNAERVCISREYQMVTGACLAIRNNVFREIEGFDENYIFGHEDLDLCLKAKKAGYKVWYNADCKVYHFESITKESIDIKKYDRFFNDSDGSDSKNNTYFNNKWENFIEVDDDKYFNLDKMPGLMTNPIIKAEFLQRIEIVIAQLHNYLEQNNEFRTGQLIDILFESLVSANTITEYDIYNVSEKRLSEAEKYISKKEFDTNSPTNVKEIKTQEMLLNNTKPKILFVMYGFNESGGGTIFPKALAIELSKMGYQIAVFYALPKIDKSMPEYSLDIDFDEEIILYGLYNRPGIFTDESHPEREIFDNKVNEKFVKILDDFKPELVHFHNFHGFNNVNCR